MSVFGIAAARRELGRTLVGFLLLWLLLDRTAAWLGSYRGEAGLAVCALVLAGAACVMGVMEGEKPAKALATLGLKAPAAPTLLESMLLCAALLSVYPIFAWAADSPLALRPDALGLALGILAQGGVAEEVVFRGFLFRRLRRGRSFWRAALLASVPFVAVHALLFLSLDFTVALASLLLALSLSFPLAWLFDRSGGSIWPSAIVHAVVQGSIKLVDAGDETMHLALYWMLASSVLPWVLVVRGRR